MRDRVWDIFLFEASWKIFFRLGLALLKRAESALLLLPIDTLMTYISTFPEVRARLVNRSPRPAAARSRPFALPSLSPPFTRRHVQCRADFEPHSHLSFSLPPLSCPSCT